ncbi:hypothetical protein Hanom_Chr00s129832g01814971 [Helianthus anomalus]
MEYYFFYTCLYVLQYSGYTLPIPNTYAQPILDILVLIAYTCLLTNKQVVKLC